MIPPGTAAAALTLAAMAAAAVAAAQEPDDCEPPVAASARVLAERFGLDETQRRGLEEALSRERPEPADLSALPGAGAELRERLEAAICWGERGAGEVRVAGRTGSGSGYTETRLERTGAAVDVALRARNDRGARRRMRGAVRVERGALRVTAGTLTARRALGLALAAPGAESRGRLPAADAEGDWRVSRGLDERIAEGVAVSMQSGAWRIAGAGLQNRLRDEPGERWHAVSVDRTLEGLRLGAVWVGLGDRPVAAMNASGQLGPGEWAVEWARRGAVSARGAAWSAKLGAVRIRGSALHADAGYRAGSGWSPSDGASTASAVVRFEGSWRLGVSRFLRLAHETEQRPADGWVGRSRWWEIEVRERLARGVTATLLWRSVASGDAGTGGADAPRETMRLDVTGSHRGWRALVRVERKIETGAGAGTGTVARWTSMRVGRDGDAAWRIRAARVALPPGGPDVYWYRRRAGGLYGFDRLGQGTWIGAWGRLPAGGVVLEASLDGKPGRWDLAAAVRWRGGG